MGRKREYNGEIHDRLIILSKYCEIDRGIFQSRVFKIWTIFRHSKISYFSWQPRLRENRSMVGELSAFHQKIRINLHQQWSCRGRTCQLSRGVARRNGNDDQKNQAPIPRIENKNNRENHASGNYDMLHQNWLKIGYN